MEPDDMVSSAYHSTGCFIAKSDSHGARSTRSSAKSLIRARGLVVSSSIGLKWEVETKCWKGAESGTIYDAKGSQIYGFYVNPMDGRLVYKKEPTKADRRAWWKKNEEDKPVVFIKIDADTAYEKVNGCWFFVKYKKNDYYNPFAKLNPNYSKNEKEIFSREWTTYERKQLNSKELKAAELVNDPFEGDKK